MNATRLRLLSNATAGLFGGVGVAIIVAACGGGSGASSGSSSDPPPAPIANPQGSSEIFAADGSVDRTKYTAYASAWTHDSVSQRLGPTFQQLNPGALDTRPTLFKPGSKQCANSSQSFTRIEPYELGAVGCVIDNDYWSESGQLAYVPDTPATNPGLDRVQVFAYYNNVFALSPRLDWASGVPSPDYQTKEGNYKTMLGHSPSEPVAMVRNYGMLQNEALVLYRGGLLAVAGTQTSRAGSERPYPGLMLPANKVPTAIAVTAGNEFALITVWDTDALRGQLAVVALEAKYLAFHTWPYMGLPNQGSWSDLKLLGYVDLPMAAPSSVAAASNGFWAGPSQTANKVLSQIDLSDNNTRAGLMNASDTQWGSIVANKGYAVVASKLDNKAVIVDLAPLLGYMRSSYLSSASSYQNATSTRGSGPGQFPLTFAEKKDITPTVVWQKSLSAPTAVLAGLKLDRWSLDHHKAYVAREDGTVHIVDTSSLMARWSWEQNNALAEVGTVQVGRNPVSMAFTRHLTSNLPLLPNGANNQQVAPDPLNNTFYVASRADREIDAVVTWGGQGQIYRRMQDSRMGDPVAVSVALRGNIVSVADFAGKSLLSFRMGGIWDRYSRFYGAGADGTAAFEFAGQLTVEGSPIAVNSANVN